MVVVTPGCRHGAPSRERCRRNLQVCARVESVAGLAADYGEVVEGNGAVDGATLEVLLRRWAAAVHPEALAIAQAMTIDAIDAGDEARAAAHYGVAVGVKLALDAFGGSAAFRKAVAARAGVGAPAGGREALVAACGKDFVGVECGCLGAAPREARKAGPPWEAARMAGVSAYRAGRHAAAAAAFGEAREALCGALRLPTSAEDGKNAGLVAWAFEAQGLLAANESLCRLKVGDGAAALAAAAKAVALAPDVPRAWARLGAARAHCGDLVGARDAYANAEARETRVEAGSEASRAYSGLARRAAARVQGGVGAPPKKEAGEYV